MTYKAGDKRSKGFPFERLFLPAFGNDGFQNIAEVQAQGIGNAQADDEGWGALSLLDHPDSGTAHPGNRAKLLREMPFRSLSRCNLSMTQDSICSASS